MPIHTVMKIHRNTLERCGWYRVSCFALASLNGTRSEISQLDELGFSITRESMSTYDAKRTRKMCTASNIPFWQPVTPRPNDFGVHVVVALFVRWFGRVFLSVTWAFDIFHSGNNQLPACVFGLILMRDILLKCASWRAVSHTLSMHFRMKKHLD